MPLAAPTWPANTSSISKPPTETAVGNALASPDADVAAELKKGAEQIRAIVARP